uniref:Uncharacterized protein n=1 Tax=Phlebotomus papatasi TaxID=29031 RepID=A0A1B0DFK0_PHLPP
MPDIHQGIQGDTNVRRNGQDTWDRRNQRTFRGENLLVDYIIDMPVGEKSENWFLVTNDDIEDLLDNDSSFIYGQMPNHGTVPIYALVSLCPNLSSVQEESLANSVEDENLDPSINDIQSSKYDFKSNPYIPLQKPQSIDNLNYFTSQDAIPSYKLMDKKMLETPSKTPKKRKREIALVIAQSVHNSSTFAVPEIINGVVEEPSTAENHSQHVQKTQEWTVSVNVPVHNYKDHRDVDYYPNYLKNSDYHQKINNEKMKKKDQEGKYPHFLVTYWMFYPYNQ